jgi:hypothetical protein
MMSDEDNEDATREGLEGWGWGGSDERRMRDEGLGWG